MEPYKRFFMLQKLLVCDKLFEDRDRVPTRDMLEAVLRHVKFCNPGGLFITTEWNLPRAKNGCSTVNFNNMSWSHADLQYPISAEMPRATLMRDGSILFAGGMHSGTSRRCFNKCFLYQDKKFVAVGGTLAPRVWHALVTLHDGRAVVFDKFIEYFSPETQRWSRSRQDAPVYAVSASAVVLRDGTVLLVGGMLTGVTASSACYIFDPEDETFTQVSSMATARMAAACVVMPDGQVLVTGGRSGRDKSTDYEPFETYKSCELYNPVSDTWSEFPSMQEPMHRHSCILMPTQIVCMAYDTLGYYGRFNLHTWEWEVGRHQMLTHGDCTVTHFYGVSE